MMLALQWNVLDWQGKPFLLLYGSLLLVCSVLSVLIVVALRSHQDQRLSSKIDERIDRLSPFDASFLIGGLDRLAQAAIVSLYRRRAIEAPANGVLVAANRPDASAHPVEHDAYDAVLAKGRLKDVRSAVRRPARPIRERLIREELLLTFPRRMVIRGLAAIPMLLLLCLGAGKIMVGVSRDKPVGFLLLLCALTVFLMFAISWNLRHTGLGKAVIRSLQKTRENQTQGTHGDPQEDALLAAWSCAVFGPAVMFGVVPQLHAYLIPPSGSGGSHVDGSDGDGGCGGGCGGCGGCGD